MTNFAIGMLFIIFCVFSLPVAFLSIRRRREVEGSGWFTALCMANITWGVLAAFEYFSRTNIIAIYFHDFKFVAISFAAICTFQVVMHTLRRKSLDKRTLTCLLAFPVCTAIVCIAERFYGAKLLSSRAYYIMQGGVRVLQADEGPWYWIHCVFCYVLLGLAAIMMMRHYARMPRKYRTSAGILLLGISTTLIVSILAIFQVLPYGLDAGPIAACVSLVFYYFAVFYPKSVDLLMSAREVVFERAQHPMLVLDSEKTIVDYNKYTAALGSGLGMGDLQGIPYSDFFDIWMKHSRAEIDKERPSIFTIHEESGDDHYQVTMNEISDKNKRPLGTHVEIKNITPAMELVHRLQEAAYFDQLTGLHNRNFFIRVGEEHDRANTFPLGVLVGDLNNLKNVNDIYGHTLGDELLQRIARILNDAKPIGSMAFRIGGDEFVVIAPGVDAPCMQRMVEDIQRRCALEECGEEPLSIALGYHMKEEPAQPLEHVVHLADKKMYQDKYDRRKR